MGLNFRKSIKIGKNTRINLSKGGGIGLSTGVKGARVSVNKKGIRTQAGTGELYYRKDYSFKKGKCNSKNDSNSSNYSNNVKHVNMDIDNDQLVKLNSVINHYKKIMRFAWISVVIGLIQPTLIFIPFILLGMLFFNKKTKRGWKLSNVVNYYRINRFDKAKAELEKAKCILEDDVTQELDRLLYEVNNVSL